MLISVYNKYHNTEKKYIITKKRGWGLERPKGESGSEYPQSFITFTLLSTHLTNIPL
jgi:hypothetical protein